MTSRASGTLWGGFPPNTVNKSCTIYRENQSTHPVDLRRYEADKVKAAQSTHCTASRGIINVSPSNIQPVMRFGAFIPWVGEKAAKGTVERAELIPAKAQPKADAGAATCTYDLGVHTRPCRQPVAAKAIATPLVTLYSRRDRDDTAGPAIGPRYGQRSETSRYSNPGTPAWPMWSRLAGDGLCPERIAA